MEFASCCESTQSSSLLSSSFLKGRKVLVFFHLIDVFLLLSVLFLGTTIIAQEEVLLSCGTDSMMGVVYQKHPQLENYFCQVDELLREHNQLKAKQKQDDTTLYIIPVVFHIIHNYDTENISDAQVYDQLSILNEDFRLMNPDTGAIIDSFKTIAADCRIEFRLAQLDPDGNCTNGINHVASVATYTGDHTVKNVVQWPPNQYLNVWVCADAADLAGHALLPAAADTLPEWDGIVILHSYIGSIGTSSPTKSIVLTHEIGHYLNLQHTWGGNNRPGIIFYPPGDTANCNMDDEVDDTPNTIGWQSCNLNGTSCGSLDNLQNYMEYAYCSNMFTQGQKQRMRATLTSGIADRNNLWSVSNLQATGVDTGILCKAKISFDKNVICKGNTVTFSDASYHDIVYREWYFEGGTPSTSNDSFPEITYDNKGIYDVSLKISNGIDTILQVFSDTIIVFGEAEDTTSFFEDFEQANTLSANWVVSNTDNEIGWEIDSVVSFSGDHCISLNNINNIRGREDELISRTINLTSFDDVHVSFKYAYAQKNINSDDKLTLYVSKNCGESWIPRKSISGSLLATVADTVPAAFLPSGHGEWDHMSIANISSSYLTEDFMFKLTFESGDGNNIYIDDIQISTPDAIQERTENIFDLKIYPIPAQDNVTIQYPDNINSIASIRLFNALGQELHNQILYELKKAEGIVCFNISQLKSGYYKVVLYRDDYSRYMGSFVKE